jgi:hypothetical protein
MTTTIKIGSGRNLQPKVKFWPDHQGLSQVGSTRAWRLAASLAIPTLPAVTWSSSTTATRCNRTYSETGGVPRHAPSALFGPSKTGPEHQNRKRIASLGRGAANVIDTAPAVVSNPFHASLRAGFGPVRGVLRSPHLFWPWLRQVGARGCS